MSEQRFKKMDTIIDPFPIWDTVEEKGYNCTDTLDLLVGLLNEQSERIKSLEMELDLIANTKLFSRRKLEEENEQLKKKIKPSIYNKKDGDWKWNVDNDTILNIRTGKIFYLRNSGAVENLVHLLNKLEQILSENEEMLQNDLDIITGLRRNNEHLLQANRTLGENLQQEEEENANEYNALLEENKELKKDLNKLYNLLMDKGMSHNELQDVLWCNDE